MGVWAALRRPYSLLALLAVAAALIPAQAQDTKPSALTIFRQVDQEGTLTQADVVRASDDSVWAKIEWAAPLAQAVQYETLWADAAGAKIAGGAITVKAGADKWYLGISVRGKRIARAPGAYTVKLLKPGAAEVVAEASFKLEPAATDPNKPKFTGTLCQGTTDDAVALGKTDTFLSDSKTVSVVYEAEKTVPAGHSLLVKVYARNGDLVLQGKPSKTEGDASRYGTGFYLAGRDWAKTGGKFTLKVFWDEDPEPVVLLPFTVKTANHWALIVAIKDYPPAGEANDLAGCDIDGQKMKALLTEAFGFPEDHVTTVLDLNATRANIEKALLDLAAKAGPDDSVVFYYSGHGAQLPDLNGDEEDGWDEAIVPAEEHPKTVSTEADMNRYLTDDRIAEILATFKTKNVTVMFDSCHAGTAVRAGDPNELTPPAGLRMSKNREFDFGRDLIRKAEDAQQNRLPDTNPASLDVGKRFVFLAACRPWELSGCTDEGGFFTNSLVPALATSEGKSWEEMIGEVRKGVMNRSFSQNPAVEGATHRLPFSLAETTADAPYVRPSVGVAGAIPSKSPEDPPKRLNTGSAAENSLALVSGQGTVYLEQIGALYDVYARSDDQLAGQPKGRVRITGDRSKVVLTNSAGRPVAQRVESTAAILSGSVQYGDRLVAAAVPVPHTRPKVLVYLDGNDKENKDALLSAGRAIYAALKDHPALQIQLEGRISEMDYAIQPRMIGGSLTTVVWSSGGWLMGRFAGTDQEMAAKVREFIVGRHQQFTRLVRLSNPSAPFRFEAAVEGDEQVRKPGETVTVRVVPGKECFLTALVCAQGGAPAVLDVPAGAVAAGQPATFQVALPAGAAGRVAIKVLATAKALDRAAVADAAAAQRVDALITQVQAVAGNGGRADFLSTEGWADTTLWVETK